MNTTKVSAKIRALRRAIYVQGGVVSGLEGFTSQEGIDVIDYDIEGASPDELCECGLGESLHHHGQLFVDVNGQG